MQQYILRRSFQSIIALFLLSIIVFGVVRLTGDPSYLLIDESASEEQRLEIRRGLGLDRPFVVQYGIFIGNFMQGDLGEVGERPHPGIRPAERTASCRRSSWRAPQ